VGRRRGHRARVGAPRRRCRARGHRVLRARLYGNLQVEIAERRQAEARLEESSRRKDEFLAMLSHELRNPLAPIRNAVEVIRLLAPPEPKLRWAADVTDRQVRQLTRLVDELLDVARISQGKIVLQHAPLDLVTLVSHASRRTSRPSSRAGSRSAYRCPARPSRCSATPPASRR
jgi:signal transduction histidine kinase